MRYTVPALLILALASGCSSGAIKTGEIDQIQADCSNVDQTIAMLTKEKDNKAERLRSGVQSVVPASAAINIVTGNYKENVNIATGKKNEKIEAKLAQLTALKTQCEAAYR